MSKYFDIVVASSTVFKVSAL